MHSKYLDEQIHVYGPAWKKYAPRTTHPSGKNPGDFGASPLSRFPATTSPSTLLRSASGPSCPPDGVVLDPMCGSRTTLVVYEMINRAEWDRLKIYINEEARRTRWSLKWVGIDIVPEYCEIARSRLRPYVCRRRLL